MDGRTYLGRGRRAHKLGYVVAYAVSGLAADGLGSMSGRGVGRGSAMVVMAAGVCLAVIATSILFSVNIKKLEV